MTVEGVPGEVLVAAILAGGRPAAEHLPPLAAIGLTRFDVWARLAAWWCEQLGPDEVAAELLPAALQHAAAAPDPDAAVLNLSRLQADLGGATLARQIAADPHFGRDLLFLLGLGTVTANALVREPGLCDLLQEPDYLAAEPSDRELAADAVRQLRHLKRPEARRDALRRWKRGQLLRIIARDVLRHEPQKTVTREISHLADACVRAALDALVAELALPHCADGQPRGLAIIGMGKWGSRELNYNSDIDLLCVYAPTADGPGMAVWADVVQRLARDLDDTTAEGRVFRVDFRLRPEGSSGSLVRSLESCAAYYQEHGEAWETQALTRARYVAGDPDVGRAFEDLAQQVAYGARIGRAGVAAIRRNRERLDARSDADRDVKEGRGGIRDIEFTVQLLQLTRGVTNPSVRRRNTWDALDALTRAGAIGEHERRVLSEAYDLLRRVEHLLQIQPVAPTRTLPPDRAAQRRLARGLGYRDAGPLWAWTRFLDDYRTHTALARALSERLFFNPIPLASPTADQQVQELLDPLSTDAEVLPHLADIPFAEPAAARRRLLFLAHGEPPTMLPAEVTAQFVELLPTLLNCVQRMPDPDAALRWFLRFAAGSGDFRLFYRFLWQHPPVIELLCRLGGFSEVLSRTIADHPELLDQVVDPRFVGRRLRREALAAQLAERLDALRPEDRLDDLRRFRRRELFRIGVQDLLGAIEVDEVMAQLSDLAEVVLEALLAELRPRVPGAADLPFAIVGCGKLGGRELHYASDLDVLFVYDSDQPGALGAAEKLAQAIMAEAGRATRAGRLWEVDARLRPFGQNSQLARSPLSYRTYYLEYGAAWERLAMLRARPVAGDAAVGDAFCAVATEFAAGQPFTEDELAELRQVKRRVETERHNAADQAHVDLKLHPGGIMDIEFIAQILQVQHLPGESGCANTPEALQRLAEAGALARHETNLLQHSYLFLRRLEARLQLVVEHGGGLLPTDTAGLAAAAKRLGWSFHEASSKPAQLVADVREQMRAVRQVFDRRLGSEP